MLKMMPALLPNGMVDLLPADAEKEAYAVDQLMQEFASFGYRRVKPPLIEFEESLLSGPGEGLSRYVFRVMDAVSHKVMGLRADITPQIARLASSRFGVDQYPLRLMYAGDVLRVKSSQLRPERQFCQVGCEIVGTDNVQADVEMALLPVIALDKLGLAGLSVDLTLPAFIRTLFGDDAPSDEFLDALDKKDRGKIAELKHPYSKLITDIMSLNGSAKEDLAKLQAMALPASVRGDIGRLAQVTKDVLQALDDMGLSDKVQVTIDPLERSVFEYHRGISFTLFQKGARGELGRGGRYDFEGESGANTAFGFTLYMDTIRRMMPALSEEKAEQLDAGTSWKEILKLRQNNKHVIRTLK